jgi:hypothetical protein
LKTKIRSMLSLKVHQGSTTQEANHRQPYVITRRFVEGIQSRIVSRQSID